MRNRWRVSRLTRAVILTHSLSVHQRRLMFLRFVTAPAPITSVSALLYASPPCLFYQLTWMYHMTTQLALTRLNRHRPTTPRSPASPHSYPAPRQPPPRVCPRQPTRLAFTVRQLTAPAPAATSPASASTSASGPPLAAAHRPGTTRPSPTAAPPSPARTKS